MKDKTLFEYLFNPWAWPVKCNIILSLILFKLQPSVNTEKFLKIFIQHCRSSYPDYHAGGDVATTAGNEGVEEGDGVAEEVDLDVLNDVSYQLVLPSGELSVNYFTLTVAAKGNFLSVQLAIVAYVIFIC